MNFFKKNLSRAQIALVEFSGWEVSATLFTTLTLPISWPVWRDEVGAELGVSDGLELPY